jgi:transposase-like protein
MENSENQNPDFVREDHNSSFRAQFEVQQSIKEFRSLYKDEQYLIRRIFDTMRLKAHDTCVCRSPISKFYEKKGRFKYRCRTCRRTVSPLSLTPIKGLRISLPTVFEIIYLTFLGKHGLTASEIARYHGIAYNTALATKHRIQIWMGLVVQAFKFENTTVEADETYVKVPTMLGPGIKYTPGLGSQRQKPIVSLVENGGLGRAKTIVVDHVNQNTMKDIFKKNVDPSSTVYTDGNPVYQFLSNEGYLHFECNHSQKIYSRNGVNVNTAESLHGLLKSKLYHVHRGITEDQLQKYAD